MKTKEFKGTKGPWEVVEHSWSDTSIYCGDKVIATNSIYEEATEDNQDELEIIESANFKLMASAPELLEALQKVYRIAKQAGLLEDLDSEEVDYIGNAISKALSYEEAGV